MDAGPVLLEPIASLKVTVPDKFTGDVMGDLNRRRGRVLGMNPDHKGKQIIEADIPMSELYGYNTDLRSMTGGIGALSGTIFGALVIGIISNGLNLIGLSSFWQLVVKGLIILLAVIIDTQKGSDSVVKRIIKNAKERA